MNDISLSQKQIILGGLLGDSSFYKKSKYVSFSHSEKQFDYLKWKHNFLDNVSDIKSTYNMVSVDGDTSTNDTVIVLANGMAQNERIVCEGEDFNTFKEALHYINERLAKNLVRDGEGATKFIEVNVNGALTYDDAKTMAKSVVKSSLFKAAVFGEDANWGRVLCAMGYSGIKFNPEKVDIVFESDAGSILLMDNGTPIVFDEDKAKTILSEKEIKVNIKISEGSEKATAWGCDLSYDYVRINGDYRS